MEMLKKDIEIHDGNWSSHYICKLGAIIIGLSIFGFTITMIISIVYKKSFAHTLIVLGMFFILYFIGSFIGYDKDNNA
jgi:hypothetical protein